MLVHACSIICRPDDPMSAPDTGVGPSWPLCQVCLDAPLIGSTTYMASRRCTDCSISISLLRAVLQAAQLDNSRKKKCHNTWNFAISLVATPQCFTAAEDKTREREKTGPTAALPLPAFSLPTINSPRATLRGPRDARHRSPEDSPPQAAPPLPCCKSRYKALEAEVAELRRYSVGSGHWLHATQAQATAAILLRRHNCTAGLK